MKSENHAAYSNQTSRMPIRLLSVLASLMIWLFPSWAWSQSPSHPAEPKLDTTKPFVIQETYRQAPPNQTKSSLPSPGIVGLDMLIMPGQYPLVQDVIEGTPAFRQGVQPGDRIVAINGIAAIDKTRSEVDALISDVPGDPVALRLLRGTRLVEVRLIVASLTHVSRTVQSNYRFLLTAN
jgi:predicted metalloprotease with PDZ domain